MKMRADPLYHLGYPDGNGQLRFSSYLCVTYRNPYLSQIVSSPPQVPPTSTTGIVSQTQLTKITFMSIKEAFNLIIVCLSADKGLIYLNNNISSSGIIIIVIYNFFLFKIGMF